MAGWRAFMSRLWLDEGGQAITEYALIIALIAVVITAAFLVLGPQIKTLFNTVSNCLQNATTSSPACP